MPNPQRVYRWLLKLYPARFREEFETQLDQQFGDEYRETFGAWSRIVFMLRALADFVVTLPAEIAREMRQDLRYAARIYRRRAFVTGLAVTALALAIGATTGVFSVVNALLLRSLPFRDAQRLVLQRNSLMESAENACLESASHYRTDQMTLSTASTAVRVQVTETSATFFTVMSASPALGRAFAPREDRPGNDQVAVISYSAWRQLFGGDPRLLGTRIRLQGVPLTVVGVAPRGFDYPPKTAVWAPTTSDPRLLPTGLKALGDTVGRLRPGTTLTQANRMYDSGFLSRHPGRDLHDPNLEPWIALRDELAGPVRRASLVLLGLVGLVLLIACANVAQLLVARVTERRPELAIRAALGASQARLLQQLVTESAVLTLAAAAAGLAVAYWASSVAAAAQPPQLSAQQYTILDVRVLAFAIGLALLTGILFGVLPTWLVGRMQSAAGGVRAQPSARSKRVRRTHGALVAAQAALVVVLIAGSLTLGQSFLNLLGTDLGFRATRVVTLSVSLQGTPDNPGYRAVPYYREALERLRAVPGVESAGAIDYVPFTSEMVYMTSYKIDSGSNVYAVRASTTPGYFRSMGIPIVQGRDFRATDTRDSEPVAIVNQQFVKEARTGSAVIGRKVTLDEESARQATIVGVVRTTRFNPSWTGNFSSQIYLPAAQEPPDFITFVARVRGDPERYLAACRDAIRSVDPQVPIYDVETFDQRLQEALARPRFYTTVVLFLGGFALLLAIIGIYGAASSRSRSGPTRSACASP